MWRTGIADSYPVELNGDGLTDFVQIHHDQARANILIGQGDGTFQQLPETNILWRTGVATSYPVELNGDGLTDLVQIHHSGIGPTSSSARETAPSYNFPKAARLRGGRCAASIPAELNGDSITDFVQNPS
ncbi:MAG: VCBS repeat-containing protein [Candidatus Competibacteraceae bacterium]